MFLVAWFQTSTAAHSAVGTTDATVTALKGTIDDVELVVNFTITTKSGEAPELTRASDGKAGYLANGDTTHPIYQDATKPVGIYQISASWANGSADAAAWAAAGKSGASTTFQVDVRANAQVSTNIYAQLIKSASTTSTSTDVESVHTYTVTITNSTGALSIASNEGKYCLRPGSDAVDTYVEAGYSSLLNVTLHE